MQFWKDMRENNVDIDFGEEEWKEVNKFQLSKLSRNVIKIGYGKKKREG